VFGVGDSMPSYAEGLPDAQTRRALVSFVLSLDGTRKADRSGP